MADNGEDYGIQQGNGGNERVMTLETQMPQLSFMDTLRYLKSNGRSTLESPVYIFAGIYSFIPGRRLPYAVSHFLLYLHGSLLSHLPMPLPSLLIILEAALAEAAEHALQELADNPEHQQYNYNISHSFSFLYDFIPK